MFPVSSSGIFYIPYKHLLHLKQIGKISNGSHSHVAEDKGFYDVAPCCWLSSPRRFEWSFAIIFRVKLSKKIDIAE